MNVSALVFLMGEDESVILTREYIKTQRAF